MFQCSLTNSAYWKPKDMSYNCKCHHKKRDTDWKGLSCLVCSQCQNWKHDKEIWQENYLMYFLQNVLSIFATLDMIDTEVDQLQFIVTNF